MPKEIRKNTTVSFVQKQDAGNLKQFPGSNGFLMLKNSGYSTRFMHLCSCYGSSNEVLNLYEMGMAKQSLDISSQL